MSDSLQPYGPQPTRLLCPRDSLGKNTGVGYHALLQGIFPTQGSNLCLLRLPHGQAGSSPLAPPDRKEPESQTTVGPARLLTYPVASSPAEGAANAVGVGRLTWTLDASSQVLSAEP